VASKVALSLVCGGRKDIPAKLVKLATWTLLRPEQRLNREGGFECASARRAATGDARTVERQLQALPGGLCRPVGSDAMAIHVEQHLQVDSPMRRRRKRIAFLNFISPDILNPCARR